MRHFLRHPLFVLVAAVYDVAAFTVPQPHRPYQPRFRLLSPSSTALRVKNKKNRSKPKVSSGRGGGFGGGNKPDTAPSTRPVSADKHALEQQWDSFASITDLEIVPPGNPDDDDYQHFIVTDTFVRVGSDNNDKPGTGWYRTGKACADGDTDIHSSLTLQKSLIFWTAVHMWPQLASKGKEAAKRLELGFSMPTLNMADETDSALDDEEAEEVQISHRVPVQGVSIKAVGFRPDFNPPGFTYKRRERAAMKKKKSAMEEIAEVS
mmetsp:Transcript_22125/g.53610  ORF Transcript_22125/g.53610 Transcript_22125/m.53610 type:complete len:264 (-) Transcript_22125:105-896(-)